MANDTVVSLFKEDDSVEKLIESVKETNPDSLFLVGLKDGTIYYGSSNYDSSLKVLGCLDIIRYHLSKSVEGT